MISAADSSFWQGKRVFITSPQSFLGSWLSLTLVQLGAQVFGYGDAAATSPSLFELSNLGQKISYTFGDLRDATNLQQALDFAQADCLIHLGDFGFLHTDDQNNLETFSRAVLGTSQLLECLRTTASIRSAIVVGSDKVYAKSEEPAKETSQLEAGAAIPTAKLCSEFVALSYRSQYFSPQKYNKHKIALATARLGVGVGGGDFAEGSFLFEAAKSFLRNEDLVLKNPASVRSWIFVLDQVEGLLSLSQALIEKGPKLAPTYNFAADQVASVGSVYTLFANKWGRASSVKTEDSAKTPSVHGTLSSALAKQDLNWQASTSLEEMLQQSASWYQKFYKNP